VFPEYGDTYRSKITQPSDLLRKDAYPIFTLTVIDGKGNEKKKRLNNEDLWGIVAATDTKQRTRMMHLYYLAEKMNCLVCGTTNRTEVVLGFFVKYGDGGVDMEPLSHLYKCQVYQLSAHLGVPKEIIERPPSPDTFSCIVSDEEFFFRIPYATLDMLLYGWEHDVPPEEICRVMGLSGDQVKRAFRDFDLKHQKTAHLRELPPVIENTSA
jgi:NAD+ synthase